jgi:hypothetical protein
MSGVDRIDQSLRRIVQSIIDESLFGLYPYVVSSFDASAQTLDANPLRGGGRLPVVSRVPIRSVKTAPRKLESGEQVILAFEGGDPALPFVVTLDYSSSYASGPPAARQGDVVTVGGNGTTAAFYPVTGAAPPFLSPAIPYLVSFGNQLAVPPVLPTPPPLQTALGAVISSGSIYLGIR